MAQTAVEQLVHYMKENFYLTYESLEKFEQAKQMEKEHHGNTWDEAIKAHEKRGNVIARSICDFDDYYNETYGNNTNK